MRKVFIRSAYNYDAREASKQCGIVCNTDTCVVKKSFKDECDINNILKRWGITGQVPIPEKLPMSGDFSGIDDFHSAMNAVRDAETAFMHLPPELRKRFGHDPQELVAFLDNGENRAEAEKLGLVAKPVEKTRDVVQAVDELAAKIVPRETK